MKTRLFLLLSIALCPLGLRAEDGEAPKENLAPWMQDFSNLPVEKRQEFARHLQKAREYFAQKRIFETLEELNQADAVFPDSPDIANMKGACQVEFRAFDKAMEHFDEARKLAPDNPNVLFNIAEVLFVTKQWDKAAPALEQVLGMLDNENTDNLMMSRLVEFKVMLCKIKLGKLEEAREMAEKYDFLDDSPFPYYAEAAIAFHEEELMKAEAALARARRIFRNPAVLSPWQDTLMEFGYIKSFFGGDLEEEE
jgi:Tfp pilus assembly protein PilF